MPDAISNPMQPFLNLVQANMALVSKYAMSPDAVAQAMSQFQAAMTQGPGAAKALPQSATAFAELAQGLMENYTRFMSELTQSGMSFFAQGQDALFKGGAAPGRRGGYDGRRRAHGRPSGDPRSNPFRLAARRRTQSREASMASDCGSLRALDWSIGLRWRRWGRGRLCLRTRHPVYYQQ